MGFNKKYGLVAPGQSKIALRDLRAGKFTFGSPTFNFKYGMNGLDKRYSVVSLRIVHDDVQDLADNHASCLAGFSIIQDDHTRKVPQPGPLSKYEGDLGTGMHNIWDDS